MTCVGAFLVHSVESWQAQKTKRRGGGSGEGVSRSPPEEGAMPLPKKTVRFLNSKWHVLVHFGAFARIMAGTKNEAPRRWVWRGGCPLPTGRGGYAPSAENC